MVISWCCNEARCRPIAPRDDHRICSLTSLAADGKDRLENKQLVIEL